MSAIVSHGDIMPPEELTGNFGPKGLDALSGKFRQLGRFFLLVAGPVAHRQDLPQPRDILASTSVPLGARAANAAATRS
jgi:hypothetical protein